MSKKSNDFDWAGLGAAVAVAVVSTVVKAATDYLSRDDN